MDETKEQTSIRLGKRYLAHARGQHGTVSAYIERLIKADMVLAREPDIVDELIKRLLTNETFFSEVSARVGGTNNIIPDHYARTITTEGNQERW